jgi:hypothetical protein
MFRRERDNQSAIAGGGYVWLHNQTAARLVSECFDGTLDFGGASCAGVATASTPIDRAAF